MKSIMDSIIWSIRFTISVSIHRENSETETIYKREIE